MNSDYDAVAEQIERVSASLDAVEKSLSSYKDHMTKTDYKTTVTDPHHEHNTVLFASQLSACAGALAMNIKFMPDAPQSLATIADCVLKCLGLAASITVAEETDPIADGIGVLREDIPDAAPVAPDVLQWPPPRPELPAVYQENYYIPRGAIFAIRAHTLAISDGYHTPPLPEPDVPFKPMDKLTFLGQVEWNQSRDCWLMRMESLSKQYQVWVFSKDVQPGDEIPRDPT